MGRKTGANSPLRRLPAYSLPVLALLALTAALLWLPSADSAQAQDDSARPEITADPTIISSPESGDAYGPKETILVALTYSEPVAVTVNQDIGGPRVRLAVGERKRWARYDRSEEEGTRLIFAYRVKGKDADSDGVSIRKNALELSGGSIEDADGNAARRKHPALPDQAGHKVNGSPGDKGQEPPPPPANSEPQFAADTATRSIPENALAGESVGDSVTADDGDDDTLTYALAGADPAAFNFDTSTGQITVKDALDYEARSNYSVTVTVHDGKNAEGGEDAGVDDSIEVAITVANMDEAGSVSLDSATETPQAGSELSAILFDPDGGVTGIAWVWESSGDGPPGKPAGVDQATYTPSEDDAGQYLRATASYSDGHGPDKTAQAETAVAVALPPEPAEPPGQNQSATLTTPMAQTVAADWTYIPQDSSNNPRFTVGQSFRLLFVTSTKPDPTSTDNTLVQTRAATNSALTNAGGTSFSGQFRALVSTSTVDARDNTATTYTNADKGVAIYWLNGAKVADDYEDFYDSNGWDSRAATIESGIANNTGTSGVWTGSNRDGTKHTQYPAGHSIAATHGLLGNAGEEIFQVLLLLMAPSISSTTPSRRCSRWATPPRPR